MMEWVNASCGMSGSSLLESIGISALELERSGTGDEAVQDGGYHRVVAEGAYLRPEQPDMDVTMMLR